MFVTLIVRSRPFRAAAATFVNDPTVYPPFSRKAPLPLKFAVSGPPDAPVVAIAPRLNPLSRPVAVTDEPTVSKSARSRFPVLPATPGGPLGVQLVGVSQLLVPAPPVHVKSVWPETELAVC